LPTKTESGGGGWGAKAGLLSLDPQTVYQDESSLQADDLLQAIGDVAQDGQYIQFFTPRLTRTKDIFPFRKGEYEEPNRKMVILGTTPSTVDAIPSERTPEQAEEEMRRQQSLDIGRDAANAFHHTVCDLAMMPFPPVKGADRAQASVANSSDGAQTGQKSDAPEIKVSTEPSTKNSMLKPSLYFRQGVFGFVSEGGMFLEQNTNRSIRNLPTIRTKIDAPYAYWYNDFRNPEPRVRRINIAGRSDRLHEASTTPGVKRPKKGKLVTKG
jgi:hypothetical protein